MSKDHDNVHRIVTNPRTLGEWLDEQTRESGEVRDDEPEVEFLTPGLILGRPPRKSTNGGDVQDLDTTDAA